MNEPSQPCRILVGVDLSAGSRAAAELTTEIASALGAEVCGLFVEEDHLLILAAHPLVRELDTWSAAEREIDPELLERRMRAQGCRARQLLAGLAKRRGVPWSFQTIRGPATAAIRTASDTVDIVTLGRVGWSPGDKRRLGGTVRALLTESERAILIPGKRAPADAPVVVCYDGSECSERALAIATELAGPMKAPLVVELLGGASEQASLRERVCKVIAAAAPERVAPTIEAASIAKLKKLLTDQPARLVVLPRSEALDGPALTELAVEMTNPVLVISSTARVLPHARLDAPH